MTQSADLKVQDGDKERSVKLAAYRDYMVGLHTKTQEEFDRTLLALSGGALGVSFAFVKDFLGAEKAFQKGFLFAAWFCWILALALTLISQYLAIETTTNILNQLDRREDVDPNRPGGKLASTVTVMTGVAGLSFLIGLLAIGYFVLVNVR